MNNSSRLINQCAGVGYSSKTFSLLSSRRQSSSNMSVSRLQTWVVLYGAVQLPPLTQTKTQHKNQETRIALCRQLWEVLCRGPLHNTTPTTQQWWANINFFNQYDITSFSVTRPDLSARRCLVRPMNVTVNVGQLARGRLQRLWWLRPCQAAVVLLRFLPTLVSHFFQVCPPPNEHNSTCCEFLKGIFDTVLTNPKFGYRVP